MSAGACLAALLGALLQGPAPAPDEVAFVELRCARATCFAGEEVPVQVSLGFEQGFLEHGLVPLFRRRLDVPAQLVAPWLDGLSGARVRRVPPAEGAGRTLAINDAEGAAVRLSDEVRGGRTFAVFALDALVAPGAAGELELAAPALRFARASAFEDDLAQGRVAADPSVSEVAGTGLALVVRPLPEQGRPAGFTGAVGRFTVTAEVRPGGSAAEEGVKLVLAVEGAGDLAGFAAPALHVPGFHTRGYLEERAEGRRVFLYDLAPESAEAAVIPPVEFAFFDPEPPGAYRVAHTAAIALERAPAPGGAPATGGGEPAAGGRRLALGVGLALAVAALAAGVLIARRSG